MGRLTVFNFITLNGYYKGPNGDISWHKEDRDAEKDEYAVGGLKTGNILLFGRVTYEMTAGYWPTPEAKKNTPAMSEGMNNADKIVFSRTLKKVDWFNTRLIKDDIVTETKKLKSASDGVGKDMTILGSGTVVAQFAEHGLIDEYQFMLDPVALADGTPIFKNIKNKLNLKLADTRTFKSGAVLLCYEPVRSLTLSATID